MLRTPLPIDDVLPELLAALQKSACAVLCAPPGAGKTTRVPPALLDAGLAGTGKILVLQPRRIAARATAARIATERGTRLGDEIGYQVRFESRTSAKTRIEILTEGILLRRLLDDPFLDGVSLVIFDEFHQRSLTADLLLGMTRQIQASVRTDLRLVVMSATLAAEPLAKYLDNCPIVVSQGRLFPVEVRYAPQLERHNIVTSMTSSILALTNQSTGNATRGHLLAFLPGVGEIRQVQRQLETGSLSADFDIFTLFGEMPLDDQQRVLSPSERPKIILATNVAETSLTIDGVTTVIDSGVARVLRFDAGTGLDRLELEPISKAAADQRAGRAGRTGPGLCLRLWPESAHRHRPDFDDAEIQRVDLAGGLLQLLGWIEPALATFPWFEPPAERVASQALTLLERLGACQGEAITPLGRQMAGLPVHPRLARMLLEGAKLGHISPIALAAALLSERDPFVRPQGSARMSGFSPRRAATTSESDVLDRVHLLQSGGDGEQTATHLGTLHRQGVQAVWKAAEQLEKLVANLPADRSSKVSPDEAVQRAILAGFPDRVARRREPGGKRGVMVGGRGVRLADEVAVGEAELFVCVVLDGAGGEALVRQASAIDRAWLPPTLLTTEVAVEYDSQAERIIARQRTLWDTLVLEESITSSPRAEDIQQALIHGAEANFAKAFPADDEVIGGFVERVRCLRQWMPDLGLPALDEVELKALLPQLVPGCRSLADLRRAPWLAALHGMFDYPTLQRIEREAPQKIPVPSGSHIRLQYAAGQSPILAVRIQEIFGLLETPRIAGGRIAVLMHLLAPNLRVTQVTGDLKSFWANAYALVRKDLRARYPKHSWPEDPYTALPQHRPLRKPKN